MILHRTIFQAKFGKADDVVAHMKAVIESAADDQIAQLRPRILTDISGTFDTVIVETVHESLASYEQFRAIMLENNAGDGNSAMLELVETGSNELYTVEYM